MATTILVISTDNGVLTQLQMMLQTAGFEVMTATDGEQGWSVFDQAAPHAIVSAVRMPNLDGIGLLRRVRSRTKDLPVLLIAGESSRDDEPTAQALGVTAFIYQPITSVTDLTPHLPSPASGT